MCMDVCFDAVVMLLVHSMKSRINLPMTFSVFNKCFFHQQKCYHTNIISEYFFCFGCICSAGRRFLVRMLNTLDLTRATSLSYTPSYSHPDQHTHTNIHTLLHTLVQHTSSLAHPHTTTHTHIPRALTTQRTHQMWETMLKVCGHQILNKRFRKHLPFIHPVVVEKSYSQMKGRCTVSWLN